MHDPFHRFHYSVRSSVCPFSYSRPHWDLFFPEQKTRRKIPKHAGEAIEQLSIRSTRAPLHHHSWSLTFLEQKLFDFPGSCQRARVVAVPVSIRSIITTTRGKTWTRPVPLSKVGGRNNYKFFFLEGKCYFPAHWRKNLFNLYTTKLNVLSNLS